MFCRAVGIFHFDALGDSLFSSTAVFHVPFNGVQPLYIVSLYSIIPISATSQHSDNLILRLLSIKRDLSATRLFDHVHFHD